MWYCTAISKYIFKEYLLAWEYICNIRFVLKGYIYIYFYDFNFNQKYVQRRFESKSTKMLTAPHSSTFIINNYLVKILIKLFKNEGFSKEMTSKA